MTQSTATPHRFEVLDSLRGVCASMIVLLHFKTPGAISQSEFVDHAFLFVDFFFVLSGFVIAASYGQKLAEGFPIRTFIGLRLGRVYPLHLVVLLAFLAFELVFAFGNLSGAVRQPFTDSNSLPSLFASLVLIHPFVGPDGTYWNGPSWSIAVEMWTYLIFAIGVKFANRWLVPLALLVALGCCLYLPTVTNRYLNVFHDGALARCVYGFSLGIVAYRWFGRFATIPLAFALATVLEIAAVIATVVIVTLAGAGPLSLAVPPVFFCVVLLFARQAGAVSRLLLLPPFLIVGTLSYSIYMVHGFLEYRLLNVLSAIESLLHHRWSLIERHAGHAAIGGTPLFGDVMSFVALGITIAVAWVTYRLIERPGQRWSRRLLLGDHPRRATIRAEQEAPTF